MSNLSNSSPTEDDLAARRHGDLSHDLELLLTRLAESREAIVHLLAARSGDEPTVEGEIPGGEGAVADEAPEDDGTYEDEGSQEDEAEYVEPRPVEQIRALRRPMGAVEPEPRAPVLRDLSESSGELVPAEPAPRPCGDVPHQLPSSLRRPGPPALELALIYRDLARNGGEVRAEASLPGPTYHRAPEVSGSMGPEEPTLPVEVPSTVSNEPRAVPVVKLPAPRRAPVAPNNPRTDANRAGTGPQLGSTPKSARRRLLAVVLTAVGAVVLLSALVSVLPPLF